MARAVVEYRFIMEYRLMHEVVRTWMSLGHRFSVLKREKVFYKLIPVASHTSVEFKNG